MTINQLSVFLENKPGQLTSPYLALEQAGVEVLGVSLAETTRFGVMRLIVSDLERGRSVLSETGAVVKVGEVVGIELSDEGKTLTGILETIESAGMNIDYMYAFSRGVEGASRLVLGFGDPQRASDLLEREGVKTLTEADLSEDAG